MKYDLSQPGLYYLLNTPEVKAEIERLKLGEKASFEKNPDTDFIARMMARAISDEVEKFIADKLKAEAAKPMKSEHWIHDAIQNLPETIELRSAAEKAIPAKELEERQILKEVKLLAEAGDTDRPTTELTESALIVPNGRSPQLGNEIERELKSCESADWLVSFIKLKAIRAFYPQLQQFCGKSNPDGSPRLRIATTTYMGATDVEALKLLFALPNTEIKVCFNTSQTRLHAKAYIFHRKTGFGSAYIGSANLSSQALTSGLEWTVKVAQQEIPHLWERSIVEFDSCWNDENFETCKEDKVERIRLALNANRVTVLSNKGLVSDESLRSYITIHPHSYQTKMIEELTAERELGKHRHLIASATGTGKTIVAAFDYAFTIKKLGRNPRLLFLAHRKDIIDQAREKYRVVLRQPMFGALISDGEKFSSQSSEQVFCTVQSWATHIRNQVRHDFFDLIVLDECHHAAADSYQEVIQWYREAIEAGKTDLLGLSATPFRADGKDIRNDFGGEFTHELSLAEAIEHGHVVPFSYFGVSDDVDYTEVNWGQGEKEQLEKILHQNGQHLQNVHQTLLQHVADMNSLRAVAFCAGLKHARAACEYFNSKGIKSIVLSGESTQDEREKGMSAIEEVNPSVHVIFTADLFNEGVDIPSVNTVLMMRPTNSPLIFLQQLGRGLRIAPPQYQKDDLLVLDFVGNHNSKYRGFERYLFMSTRKDIPVQEQVKQGMPFLPAGCSISLSEQAQTKVLENIQKHMAALRGNTLRSHLLKVISDARTHLPLRRLMDEISASSPAPIFRYTSPAALEAQAFNTEGPEDEIGKGFNSLAQTDSPRMINSWVKVLSGSTEGLSPEDVKMAKFFLLSAFDDKVRMSTVDQVWHKVLARTGICRDLCEFLEWRQSRCAPMSAVTFDQTSKYLELHRSYSSKQIAAAIGTDGMTIQGGVYCQKNANSDTFFITRLKGDKDFSPTTMYKDHAKSQTVFHWESPNNTKLVSDSGRRYISDDFTKMLFIRQSKRVQMDITGTYPIGNQTSGYVFLGPVKRVLAHEGECPIGIDYELQHPIPADVFEYARGA
jgi:superfamily II DNA or RNA helicase/HKD family nuclease